MGKYFVEYNDGTFLGSIKNSTQTSWKSGLQYSFEDEAHRYAAENSGGRLWRLISLRDNKITKSSWVSPEEAAQWLQKQIRIWDGTRTIPRTDFDQEKPIL